MAATEMKTGRRPASATMKLPSQTLSISRSSWSGPGADGFIKETGSYGMRMDGWTSQTFVGDSAFPLLPRNFAERRKLWSLAALSGCEFEYELTVLTLSF